MDSDEKGPKKPKPVNRNAIRMSVMSRLFASHYKKTGENIEGSSAIGCQRWRRHTSEVQDKAQIAITRNGSSYAAKMHDHFICGNHKFCPHCARAGAAKMRDYITQIFVPAVKAQGYALALMTLTASHRRDCDWKADYADLFFEAVTIFHRRMHKAYKTIGCPGQLRGIENPVGENGLHLHIHDELLYKSGSDLKAFTTIAKRKWQEACKQVGLYCNAHGLHLKIDFDPCYIAKDDTEREAKATAFELAAYDTKEEGTNRTLFALLDACARGDEEAGKDYIRAALALQGRARWNIGGLAKKLSIEAPSKWHNNTRGDAEEDTQPAMMIEYPIEDHLIATTPGTRHSLALILRAARQEHRRTGTVSRMVKALADEAVNTRIAHIRRKYAGRLARRLDELWSEDIHEAVKRVHQRAIVAAEYKWMSAAIEHYAENNRMMNPVYAAAQRAPITSQLMQTPMTPQPTKRLAGKIVDYADIVFL